MSCWQAGPSPQAAEADDSQTEVEELNERLFELRVEVQNLAEDNSISLASITRKVLPQCHHLSFFMPHILQ